LSRLVTKRGSAASMRYRSRPITEKKTTSVE
jgi:hypothetical protein